MSERIVLLEGRLSQVSEEGDRFRTRFTHKKDRGTIFDLLAPEVTACQHGKLYRIVAEEIPVKTEPPPGE